MAEEDFVEKSQKGWLSGVGGRFGQCLDCCVDGSLAKLHPIVFAEVSHLLEMMAEGKVQLLVLRQKI